MMAAIVTSTAVCGEDNGGNSNGSRYRKQSTIIGSKNMVAVATAMETAAAGTATTAVGMPTTDHISSWKQRRRRP